VLKVAVWRPNDIRDVGKVSLNVDGVPLGTALAKCRTDITDCLLAGECENVLCIALPGTAIQVHHVRALANVGQSAFVEWLISVANRKTRYLCAQCHPMVRTSAR